MEPPLEGPGPRRRRQEARALLHQEAQDVCGDAVWAGVGRRRPALHALHWHPREASEPGLLGVLAGAVVAPAAGAGRGREGAEGAAEEGAGGGGGEAAGRVGTGRGLVWRE